MDGESLGMLTLLERDYRRVYVGRNGVFLCGFRDGTSRWRPLWLWWRGYLKLSAKHTHGWGSPAVYLVISDKGRAFLAAQDAKFGTASR